MKQQGSWTNASVYVINDDTGRSYNERTMKNDEELEEKMRRIDDDEILMNAKINKHSPQHQIQFNLTPHSMNEHSTHPAITNSNADTE